MINLLHAEFFKLRKSSLVKIGFIICIICSISMAYVSHQVQTGNVSQSALTSASGLCEAMVVTLLGSFLIGSIVCTDFESKTIHDQITCTHGRLSIVIVKMIMAFVAVIILMLPYIVTTIVAFASGTEFSKLFLASAFARMMSSGVEVSASSVGKILALSLLLIFGYTAKLAICVPLSFKIKKPAIIMAIGFTLGGLMDFLVGLIEKDSFLDKVIKLTPFSREYSLTSMDTEASVIIKGIILAVIFIALIGVITYAMFRKAEIK